MVKHELGEVPDGHYTVPLGKAAIRREGAAVTILAYGTMVHVAEAAAAETGIDAEIIDLRTLAAAGSGDDRRLGPEDRPVRDRSRGDADVGVRRGAFRACAGSTASIIWRRRSREWQVGIRRIRMLRNGIISRARPASGARCSKRWRP